MLSAARLSNGSDAVEFRITTGYEPTVAGVTQWLAEQQLVAPRTLTSDVVALRVWRSFLMPAPAKTPELATYTPPLAQQAGNPPAEHKFEEEEEEEEEEDPVVVIEVSQSSDSREQNPEAGTDTLAVPPTSTPTRVSTLAHCSTVPRFCLNVTNPGKRPLSVILRDLRVRGRPAQTAVFGGCECGQEAQDCECIDGENSTWDCRDKIQVACGCQSLWHSALCDDIWKTTAQHRAKLCSSRAVDFPECLREHEDLFDRFAQDPACFD